MKKAPQTKKRTKYIVICIVLFLAVVATVVIVLNREWIYDWYRGVTYQPTSEMARLRSALKLTGRGEFLFDAAQPVLSEATEFNQKCRQNESELAVLGCYTEGNIYVYNITEPELSGIRELTTAHELLHARWVRMSQDEKVALVEPLTRVFEANQDVLGEEIDPYDTAEKQEELYVRAGTEVKDLPLALERHYAEIFEDQDRVVEYYDSYIAVFREIKAKMERLKNEMEELRVEISTKTTLYETMYGQLEADIVSFNSCAAVAGCFGSTEEFELRRAGLVARQAELENINNEINELIDTYNAKVDEYNSDVTESRKLQDMINSNSKIESVY